VFLLLAVLILLFYEWVLPTITSQPFTSAAKTPVTCLNASPELKNKQFDEKPAKLYNALINYANLYWKTEPVNGFVFITYLICLFQSPQHVTVAGISNMSRSSSSMRFKTIRPLNNGLVYRLSQKNGSKMEGNEYYTKIHDELSKKIRCRQIDCSANGGLEWCHY
jgi:hypothetical protein